MVDVVHAPCQVFRLGGIRLTLVVGDCLWGRKIRDGEVVSSYCMIIKTKTGQQTVPLRIRVHLTVWNLRKLRLDAIADAHLLLFGQA